MTRLELQSQFGDKDFGSFRYVVHWTANATETASVIDSGLEFIEGQPLFSTSMVHPRDYEGHEGLRQQTATGPVANGEPGSLLICAVPMNYHLGYGIFTTAYIDRQEQVVTGSAVSYTEGRKRMAMYAGEDTEAERRRIEAEVSSEYPIEQHPRVKLDRPFILARIGPSQRFDQLVARIDTLVRGFEMVDYERLAAGLLALVEPINMQATELLPAALEELVKGTVEAIVSSRLRVMRWQGLSLQGYKFFEGGQLVKIAPVVDKNDLVKRMYDFESRVESASLFMGKVAWLKEYVAHELAVMKVELEGAEPQPGEV